MYINWLFLLWPVWLLILNKSLAISPSLIHTPLGDVQGYADSHSRYFLGLPYSEPPLGTLRFRPAVHKKPWEDVYPALEFKPRCLQQGLSIQNEDCLYLQVFTPPDIPSGKLFPVLFWIHGGGHLTGSGADYNGTTLANKGTIVVTINYRLGAFGYLQSKDLQSEDPEWPSLGGMNGINDQLVALRWTIDNIASFGGNPGDITISGESAGSLSTCFHLVSPQTKGLFNNAILESGSCIGPWGAMGTEQGLQNTGLLMKSIGVANVKELREVSTTRILNNVYYRGIKPSLDDFWLPEQPITYFEAGKLSTRSSPRFLLGTNTQDSLYGFPWNLPPSPPTTRNGYKNNLLKYFDNSATEIQVLYPAKSDAAVDVQKAWLAANTDTCNTCPTRLLADILSTNNTVFLYRFGYNPDYPSKEWEGLACHGCELPFVWHGKRSVWPYDEDLSNSVVDYWTHFVHGTEDTDPKWEKYKIGEEQYLYITKPITMEKGYKSSQCDFWLEYVKDPNNFTKYLRFCVQS